MSNYKFGNEYPVLLTVSLICKVIGIVFIVFAVIGFFYGISLLNESDKMMLGVILIVSSLLSGLLFSIPFFAFPELIKVFVRIEFNTRSSLTSSNTQQSINVPEWLIGTWYIQNDVTLFTVTKDFLKWGNLQDNGLMADFVKVEGDIVWYMWQDNQSMCSISRISSSQICYNGTSGQTITATKR